MNCLKPTCHACVGLASAHLVYYESDLHAQSILAIHHATQGDSNTREIHEPTFYGELRKIVHKHRHTLVHTLFCWYFIDEGQQVMLHAAVVRSVESSLKRAV